METFDPNTAFFILQTLFVLSGLMLMWRFKSLLSNKSARLFILPTSVAIACMASVRMRFDEDFTLGWTLLLAASLLQVLYLCWKALTEFEALGATS
ncbi:MAG: hypothetical protein AAFP97_10860 [Pseudomonadota bacterium]